MMMNDYHGKRAAREETDVMSMKIASPEKPGMSSAIDSADYELEALGEIVERLNMKLQPILTSPMPSPGDQRGTRVEDTNSDIQNVFHRQAERLARYNDALREILSRVDF